jgi:hypothetical protein
MIVVRARTAHGRRHCDSLRCLAPSMRVEAMKRRPRAGGERVKSRHRKTVTRKRQNVSKARPIAPSLALTKQTSRG